MAKNILKSGAVRLQGCVSEKSDWKGNLLEISGKRIKKRLFIVENTDTYGLNIKLSESLKTMCFSVSVPYLEIY